MRGLLHCGKWRLSGVLVVVVSNQLACATTPSRAAPVGQQGECGMSKWCGCRRLWLLLVLFPSLTFASTADGSVPGIRDMRFRNYSVMQGLPQATARAIVQDSVGFFWIGTQDGLARFDGYEFKVFKHDRKNPGSLSDNYVQAMVADDRGGLWIATRSGGLDHYLPWQDRFQHWRADPRQAGSLASDSIDALAIGAQRRLWIAAAGRLQWIDHGDAAIHDAALGQQAGLFGARTMHALPDGSLIVGGRRGLWHVDGVGKSMLRIGPADLDVYALAFGADGSLWVGTAADGLYHLTADGKVLAHETRQPQAAPGDTLADNEIRGLLMDRNGTLWIAGNTAGLASFDPRSGRFRHFPHRAADRQSVAANRLWTLYEGEKGLLLIGSWTNGFSIHDPSTEFFKQIYSVPGDPRTLPAAPAMTVFGAADGTLWAGVIEGGGLVHIDMQRGVTRRYVHDPSDPNSLSNDFVQYVTRAHDGGLWVATIGGGLDHLRADGSGFDHLRHDPDDPGSLASDSVLFVLEDQQGTLWVATKDQGLDARCAGCKAFRHYVHAANDAASLSSNAVSSLAETRDGDLWAGTRNAGLDRLDRHTGKFTHYTVDGTSGLGANSISCLFEDRQGRLWVGTQGGALNMKFLAADGAVHFKTVGQRNGLNNDAIGGILQDASGQLWVSTIKGISRIDPATDRVVNYSGHDGASQLGYWVNSATQLASGALVFGGLSGITLFDPSRLPRPDQPVPVLTDMLIAGHAYTHSAHAPGTPRSRGKIHKSAIALRHDQNDVSFEFSALQYSNPESIEYEYRLQGYDRAWVHVSWRRRVATYTGLAPGTYTLDIRARSGNGQWNSDPTMLSFVILKPLWRTPLAYAVYSLVALLLVLAASWLVRRGLRRRHQIQETIRQSEARLKLALWSSGTEMWHIDLRDNSIYRDNQLPHIAASEDAQTQTLAGYLPFLHPDDKPAVSKALYAHLKQQTPNFEASYRTLDRDHNWIWLLSRGEVVERSKDGRALRMSGTSSDINALKQAEDALRALNEDLELRVERRTAELNERNSELRSALEELTQTQHKLLEAEKLAALGGLVAGVAHEINTPVGVAVTAASFLHGEARQLQQTLAAGRASTADLQRFGAKAQQSSDMILRNLRSASRLISSFKQVAVAQSNDDMAVVDLGECLEQILITLGPMLKKSPHRVDLSIEKPIEIRTSPGALYQIVTNLVTNSLTHGFAKTQVGCIHMEAKLAAGQVTLSYRDDGVGMSPEILAHLYDPFFTTRRGQGGSGLGMHIVYNLVTQILHGDIQCHSEPGVGTTFIIRFAGAEVQAAF